MYSKKNEDKDVCIRNEKNDSNKTRSNNKAKLEQTRPATRKNTKAKAKNKKTKSNKNQGTG